MTFYSILKYAHILHIFPVILSFFKDTYNINNDLMEHKEIISRLKFIGKLQKGEKINVKHMYIQPDGLTTKISRTLLYQDNRHNTLTFVRNTINKTFELMASYYDSTIENQRQLCPLILVDLKQSKTGLNSLRETYLDDIKFACDIETLIQELDSKISEYETTHDNVKEYIDNEELEE